MNPELHDRLAAALERPHRLGMIGGELEEQLAHCASFSRVLGQVLPSPLGKAVEHAADLGTGGGVPGLALSVSFPHLLWTLVEIRTSRAREVERAALRLGSECRVLTERAQDLGHQSEHRERYGVVVARAFGPSPMTAECAAGLLRVDGVLVVSEPPRAGSEVERWPEPGLAALGLSPASVIEDDGHRFAFIQKRAPIGDRLPRRSATALKDWAVSRETEA